MKRSEIVNKIHSCGIAYMLLGWMFESQRKYLILFITTVQFQFLMNNNQCLMTQLENKLLHEEKREDKLIKNSFVEDKLKQMNIQFEPEVRDYLIHSCIYGSFLMSYYLM